MNLSSHHPNKISCSLHSWSQMEWRLLSPPSPMINEPSPAYSGPWPKFTALPVTHTDLWEEKSHTHKCLMKLVRAITIVPCRSNYNWFAKLTFFFIMSPADKKHLTEMKHLVLFYSSTFHSLWISCGFKTFSEISNSLFYDGSKHMSIWSFRVFDKIGSEDHIKRIFCPQGNHFHWGRNLNWWRLSRTLWTRFRYYLRA